MAGFNLGRKGRSGDEIIMRRTMTMTTTKTMARGGSKEKVLMIVFQIKLLTVLILAAWPVSVLTYHILVLVGWYLGRYFEH